uniref:Ribosomal protein S19 n=1 Tax=Strombidium cf. sulcatum TaxID=2793073 RepID=A0A7T0M4N1_9SPIT|nr:ribosomal protein S19 [Strombidium cf. sulcatum]QPL15951.1 ribosomal protein S19 [Strombidium cf. sulcatum]
MMGNLYKYNYSVIKKKAKLNYFAPNVWRSMYLIEVNPINRMREKKIYTRSSVLPVTYLKSEILIYSGKKWTKKFVNKWMVGHKVGEFTWNRKYALYKAKQLKKKKKK